MDIDNDQSVLNWWIIKYCGVVREHTLVDTLRNYNTGNIIQHVCSLSRSEKSCRQKVRDNLEVNVTHR